MTCERLGCKNRATREVERVWLAGVERLVLRVCEACARVLGR
jgi:hypothetical protein